VAADHYASALRFAAGLPPRQLAELLEPFAVESATAGRMTEAIDAAQQALAVWRAEGDREREGVLLARSALYLWNAARSTEAHAAAASTVELLDPLGPGSALAAAWTSVAYLRMLGRDIDGAIEAGGRAIGLAGRFEDDVLLARALNAVGTAQWFADPDQAPATLARSLEAARRAGDDNVAAAALVNLGSGAGEIRRYRLADHCLGEALVWCAERDLDDLWRYALAWLARRGAGRRLARRRRAWRAPDRRPTRSSR
jgi:tetratricopeptide (TPR) repeat protein